MNTRLRTAIGFALFIALVASSTSHAMYSPQLGRFMQRDVYASGLPIVAEMTFHGRTPLAAEVRFVPLDQYSDGMNLYSYNSLNPSTHRDPTGLFSLIDLAGTSGIVNDMNAQEVDMGFGVLGALKGLIGHYNYQNEVIADALGTAGGLDDSAIDRALALNESFQTARNAMLITGLMSAGVKFAIQGFGRYAKGVTRAAGRWALKPFTKDNFRHNLKAVTGVDPGTFAHAHHVFPRKFEKEFASLGITVNNPKFGVWWEQKSHLSSVYTYNEAWRNFLRGKPTKDQAIQFGRDIASRYGLRVRF